MCTIACGANATDGTIVAREQMLWPCAGVLGVTEAQHTEADLEAQFGFGPAPLNLLDSVGSGPV